MLSAHSLSRRDPGELLLFLDGAIYRSAWADELESCTRGVSTADIAGRLHLSEGAVSNHVSAIFAKLDVTDRTNAAIIAIRHCLG